MSVMHPEDIKSELRKRFGTVRAFERSMALPERSVSDVLRGRKSRRTESAIVSVLNTHELIIQSPIKRGRRPNGANHKTLEKRAQRLNAGGK